MADENTSTQEDEQASRDTGSSEADAQDQAQPESESGAKATEGDEKKEDDKGSSEAPEKYEDFTFPEGFQADKSRLETAVRVFKELGLSQEAAQKLIDLDVAREQEGVKANQKYWDDLKEKWEGEVKADPEIGGDNFEQTNVYAQAALKEFGGEKLSEALDMTGMGSHPEVIRLFAKVGKAMSDDKFHFGRGGGQEGKSHADILYPNQGKS